MTSTWDSGSNELDSDRPHEFTGSESAHLFIHSFIPLRTLASSRSESNFLSDQTKPHVTSGKNENIFQEDSCKIRLLQDTRDWKSIRIWSVSVKGEEGSELSTINYS